MIKIVNEAEKAKLYIYGMIIDDTDAGFIKRMTQGNSELEIGFEWPTKIKEQLDGLKGKPIEVHIASDGGDVAAGIAIYNMLTNHDAPVTVFVDSWAASIASVIAFAGSKIIMPENTFLMIHNPKGGAFGESSYLRTVADWLDKLQSMIVDTYAKHTTKTADEIKEFMDKETWFTAKEAAELFDNIEVVDSNDVEAVACYKSSFDTAPVALKQKAVDNTQVDTEKVKILNILREAFKL